MLATSRAIGLDGGLVWQTCLPMLGANAFLALRHTIGAPDATAELSLAFLVVAATLGVALRLVTDRASTLDVLAVAGYSAGAAWIGLRLAEDRSTTGYDSWILGLVAVGLTLLSFFSPPRWVFVLVTPTLVCVLVVVTSQGVELAAAAGAINSPVTPPVIGCLLGSGLRWSRRMLDDETARTSEATRQAQLSSLLNRAGGADAGMTTRVIDFLDAIAEGSTDPGGPQVRERARRLGESMRDELTVPGQIDITLRQRIERRREEGVQVVIDQREGHPRDALLGLRLLDRLLDLPQPTSLILTLPSVEEPMIGISVDPPLDAADLARITTALGDLETEVISDRIATTVEVTLAPLLISEEAGAHPAVI